MYNFELLLYEASGKIKLPMQRGAKTGAEKERQAKELTANREWFRSRIKDKTKHAMQVGIISVHELE